MLHLVTQRDQPYGSYRRCCERCGVASGPYYPGGTSGIWTDDIQEWNAATDNCLISNRVVNVCPTVLGMTEQQREIAIRDRVAISIPSALAADEDQLDIDLENAYDDDGDEDDSDD